MQDEKFNKSKIHYREEQTLAFWQKEGIFEKSLLKNKDSGKEFVFYDGPATVNAKPGIHHLEARAFKDAIPRYKTMRGFYVRRKGGWDTHGLPVELQVEKELGFKSKKEIESYGIAEFNQKCKESVWKYVHEWEDFTNRSGYWVDLKDPYITYRSHYIESLWNIVKTVYEKGLLYKDYKVVPWCPRCGTALSSHELAQGYQDVKDLSVYIKFKVVGEDNTYLLAWTTTPWTLPGNVGLAVGKKIEYVAVTIEDSTERYVLARDRLSILKDKKYTIVKNYTGEELVDFSYEPLYPFLSEHISGGEKEKLQNAYKVYPADFVTTTDGTGIVHTAVMYGQDDFELGTKVGLPKFHLVKDDGTFTADVGFLAGKFVKDEETDVAIIKDLAHKGLLFGKEKYTHSSPFCWRCKTPLIYFARDSWYIKMSALREQLVKENQKIHWEPDYIKDGRFGEWLSEVKDWAISRERYWGTPLPVWVCDACGKKKVVGSIADIEGKNSGNTFLFVRHGESENNVVSTLNSDRNKLYHLTEKGKQEAEMTAKTLSKKKVDLIFTSPFLRTKETAEILADKLGISRDAIVFDERLVELNFGVFEGVSLKEFIDYFKTREEHFVRAPEKGEHYGDVKKRVADFLFEVDKKFTGKNIVVVSHDGPIWMMTSVAAGLDVFGSLSAKQKGRDFIKNAGVHEATLRAIPRNEQFELDLHRPYIDAVELSCTCGSRMHRVKEVMDVWFDSGSMPFAQDHYPFDFAQDRPLETTKKELQYPADFIAEAIDQTRGWFYTLHAVGVLMGKGHAYNNVISLGHILDAEGKKMSKSVGNIVDPFVAIEKYGADPLRFWMYSINNSGESKNFDERTVDEVVKKVFNLASNVLAFYQMYASSLQATNYTLKATHVLDQWILARLNQLVRDVTTGLEQYKLLEPTRAIRDFIADLSQWYLRRSRDRIRGIMNYELGSKEGADAEAALLTTRFVLLELSKLMAPFTPFFAEYLYKSVGGEKESVHLEEWPREKRITNSELRIMEEMQEARNIVSLALEARAKAGIKVRQPLTSLRIKNKELGIKGKGELLHLIADEVNVKEVVMDAKIANDVELDITLTPELKEEGQVREFIRAVQELRKKKGLNPGNTAVLHVKTDDIGKTFFRKNKNEIQKSATLSDIQFSDVVGETVATKTFSATIDILH